jgi:hypothetical protein
MSLSQNFPTIPPSLLLDFANVKALDPRVTFTRASQGRFYDGVTTAKAEENLLLRSQELATTPWVATATTVTANVANAPDGTATAEKIVASAANTLHKLSQSFEAKLASVPYVYSMFVKPDGYTVFVVRDEFWGEWTGVLDLTGSGSVTSSSGGTFTVTAINDGWYRVSVVFTNARTQVAPAFAAGPSGTTTLTFTGNGTDGALVWGAQLEQRSAVTAYTPTTTQPITNYIPVLLAAQAGVPRFDHNPTTGVSLGLLIEEQRTNLALYSAQFDDAYWSKADTAVDSNTIVAPDGTLTGEKLYENTATGQHRLLFATGITISTGVPYTYTIYAKSGERSRLKLANNGNFGAIFDLSSGTIVETNAGFTSSITPVGNNWYRCAVTETSTASATGRLIVLLVSSGTTISYTGDGYSGIYIWGAQLEAGAFPTSYIPTVASQVTRSADAASMTGVNFSSWYRADEGSIVAGFGVNQVPSLDARLFYIGDGTTSNLMESNLTTATNVVRFNVSTGGASQAAIITSATAAQGTQNWAVATYKVNDFAATANGAAAVTDTVGTVPVPNQLVIGNYAGLSRYINGTIRKIAYYPKRLANAEIVALTAS